MYIIGINPTETTTTQEFDLGVMGASEDGGIWRYVQANGALRANNCALIDQNQAEPLTTTNDDHLLAPLGFTATAFVDDEYGWIQVYGDAMAEVNGAVAANGLGLATTEGGRITDGGAAASALVGIFFPAAIADNATGPVFLSFPHLNSTAP